MKNKIVSPVRYRFASLIVGIMLVASSAFALPWKSGQSVMKFQFPSGGSFRVQGITENGTLYGEALLTNDGAWQAFYYNGKGYILDRPGITSSTIWYMNSAGTMQLFMEIDTADTEDVIVRIPFFKGFREVPGIVVLDKMDHILPEVK